MLLGDRRVELATQLAAMAVDVALRRRASPSMLPAFEALGKPQKLEVIVACHAGSVLGRMLEPRRSRSAPNLIGNGVLEI